MKIKYAHLTKKLFHPETGEVGDYLLLATDKRSKNRKVLAMELKDGFLEVTATDKDKKPVQLKVLREHVFAVETDGPAD